MVELEPYCLEVSEVVLDCVVGGWVCHFEHNPESPPIPERYFGSPLNKDVERCPAHEPALPPVRLREVPSDITRPVDDASHSHYRQPSQEPSVVAQEPGPGIISDPAEPGKALPLAIDVGHMQRRADLRPSRKKGREACLHSGLLLLVNEDASHGEPSRTALSRVVIRVAGSRFV